MEKLLQKLVWNYYFCCSISHGHVGKPYACAGLGQNFSPLPFIAPLPYLSLPVLQFLWLYAFVLHICNELHSVHWQPHKNLSFWKLFWDRLMEQNQDLLHPQTFSQD